MNYQKIYQKFIESRQKLNREFHTGCGFEKHHIIPKSLGGTNEKSNIIVLTPREHGFSHTVLSRMYTGYLKAKMCYALLALFKLRNKNRNIISSRDYEKLRNAHYRALQDPDYRAMRSANIAKQWTPERRASVAAKTKAQWENGPKRKIFASVEYKTKKSQQMRQRWQDPVYQQEQSARAQLAWAENGYLRKRSKT